MKRDFAARTGVSLLPATGGSGAAVGGVASFYQQASQGQLRPERPPPVQLLSMRGAAPAAKRSKVVGALPTGGGGGGGASVVSRSPSLMAKPQEADDEAADADANVPPTASGCATVPLRGETTSADNNCHPPTLPTTATASAEPPAPAETPTVKISLRKFVKPSNLRRTD